MGGSGRDPSDDGPGTARIAWILAAVCGLTALLVWVFLPAERTGGEVVGGEVGERVGGVTKRLAGGGRRDEDVDAARTEVRRASGQGAEQRSPATVLRGVVVDPLGQPVAGAEVLRGDARVLVTDESGEFVIDARRPDAELYVVARGYVPERLVRPEEIGPDPWIVRLDRSGLRSLRSRLVDGNGDPLAGWTVDVVAATERSRRMHERVRGTIKAPVTSEDGQFEIPALWEDVYRVVACRETDLANGSWELRPEDAPPVLVVDLSGTGTPTKARIVLVDQEGRPCPGVAVYTCLMPSPGLTPGGFVLGALDETDRHGACWLELAAAPGVSLCVEAPFVEFQQFALPHERPPQIEFSVRLRHAIELHVPALPRGTASLVAVDRAGLSLPLDFPIDGGRESGESCPVARLPDALVTLTTTDRAVALEARSADGGLVRSYPLGPVAPSAQRVP